MWTIRVVTNSNRIVLKEYASQTEYVTWLATYQRQARLGGIKEVRSIQHNATEWPKAEDEMEEETSG